MCHVRLRRPGNTSQVPSSRPLGEGGCLRNGGGDLRRPMVRCCCEAGRPGTHRQRDLCSIERSMWAVSCHSNGGKQYQWVVAVHLASRKIIIMKHASLPACLYTPHVTSPTHAVAVGYVKIALRCVAVLCFAWQLINLLHYLECLCVRR